MFTLTEAAIDVHKKELAVSAAYSDQISKSAMKNRVVSLNGIGNVQLSLGNPDVKRVITTYMSRLTNFIEDELGTTN